MGRKRILAVCVSAAIVASAVLAMPGTGVSAGEATHQVLKTSRLPQLVPARAFFASRLQTWAYTISPDGRRLAWFERRFRRIRLHIRDIDDGTERTIRLRRPGRGLRWAHDNRHLMFLRDRRGDENHRLFVVDAEAPDAPPRIVTPGDGVKTAIVGMIPDEPGHIVVKMNLRDRSLFDLHRVDIRTGTIKPIATNPGDVLNWIVDRRGRPIARYRRLVDGDWALDVHQAGSGAWKPLSRGAFDAWHSLPFPSRKGSHGWGFSSLGRDKSAIVRIDLTSGRETVVYGHPDVDVARFWFDRQSDRLLMAQVWEGYPRLHFFDSALGADLSAFRARGPADIRIISRSRDLTRMIVRVSTDRAAREFYLLDRTTGKRTLLAADPIAEYSDVLSSMVPISFKSRDGLDLHGYLTVPKGTDGRNLPMVLKVHGGPWLRDHWRYDALTQFLANRGYAVLAVNYRGSSGYGHAFRRAIKREFARKAHDDLIDGVNWAIAKGIADPSKIAIYGRSYGGYATLVGLTFTPDVFAAGIDVVGISDLNVQVAKSPPYWKLGRTWHEYVGDAAKPEDRADMAARSPINFVDRIKRPLLVVHGANDVRVVRENSDRLVAAMRAAGKSVEYLLFEDEGHSIRKPRNRLTMARRIESFLARHLGGRSED